LDIYTPESVDFETIVYIHGGGLEGGDKSWNSGLAEGLTEAGYAFVSVNYRCYPIAKFPDYLEDAAQAVAFVKAHIGEYGGNGEIYVSGSSAGAWLSLMLCLDGKSLQKAGVNPQEVKGWIIDSAQTSTHFNVQKYEKGLDPRLQRIDEFAPLYYINDQTKFSKMLLLFYENDMPCRPEQNLLFYKSVLYFNAEADIQYALLSGGHCAGVAEKDEDGEYPFVKRALVWLKEKR
jgi:pimeloyl-ACP methyl ester carboxylesterase